jgi:outer membrane protein assembly factor BamB
LAGILVLLTGTAVAQPPQAAIEQRGLLQLMTEIEAAASAQNWLDAAEKFDAAWQQASGDDDPLLVETGADVRQLAAGETEPHAGGKSKLEDLYQSLPPEFRAEYQRQFAELASQRIAQAIGAGDHHAMRELAARYAFCPAAAPAWRLQAGLAIDRGQPLDAALMLGRSIRLDAQPDPQILVQMAVCYARAGLTSDAADIVQQLSARADVQTLRLPGRDFSLPADATELQAWVQRAAGGTTTSADWLESGGSSRRIREQSALNPGVDVRWKQELFELNDVLFADEYNPLLARCRTFVQEARRSGLRFNSVQVPAAAPLTFQNLLIFRLPCGVRAVDRRTGELVWEVADPDSQLRAVFDWINSQLLAGQPDERPRPAVEPPPAAYTDPGQMLLTQLLRTNAAGQMAIGHNTLFVVHGNSGAALEDNGLPFLLSPDASPLPSNFIRAYDAATGVFLWEVGGKPSTRVAGARANLLAGYQFLGVPSILGNRIYVLAENADGVFLIQIGPPRASGLAESGIASSAVDPSSLNPIVVSSQLLTVPQFRLSRHPLRKHAGLVPSFAGGLLICPTCDERIVAVSAEDHSIRWMFRYAGSLRTQDLGGDAPVLAGSRDVFDTVRVDLDSRWVDSLPRIAGDRVLVTQRDSDQLHCLDLQTGTALWSLPRGSFHAIAAVTDDAVVLVGNRVTAAFRLTDGREIWTTEIRSGIVCGTAAAGNGRLHLPTSEPSILTLDLQTGRRLVEQPLSTTVEPGNLLVTSEGLVSQGLTQLSELGPAPGADSAVLRATARLLQSLPAEAELELQTRLAAEPEDRAARDLLIQLLLERLRSDPSSRQLVQQIQSLIRRADADRDVAGLLQAFVGMTPVDAALLSSRMTDRSARFRGELSELLAGNLSALGPDVQELSEDQLRQLADQMTAGLLELPAAHREPSNTGTLVRDKAAVLIAGIRRAIVSRSPADRVRLQQVLVPAGRELLANEADEVSRTQLIADLLLCDLPLVVLDASGDPTAAGSTESAASDRALLREWALLRGVATLPGEQQRLGAQLLQSWARAADRGAIHAWLTEIGTVTKESTTNAGTAAASPSPSTNGNARFATLRFRPSDLAAAARIGADWSQLHPELTGPAPSVWGSEPPQLTVSDDRSVMAPVAVPDHIPDVLIPLYGAPGLFRGWSLVRELDADTIDAYDADGVLRWSFDPPEAGLHRGYAPDEDNYATTRGHLLLLCLDGVLHTLDTQHLVTTVEEQSSPDDEGSDPLQESRPAARQMTSPTVLWSVNVSEAAPDNDPDSIRDFIPTPDRLPQYHPQLSGYYPVGPANELAIPVISGRRLLALDPVSGLVRWLADGIARDAVMLVSGDSVLLLSESNRQIEVRSLIDGSVRETPRLPDWWTEAVGNVASSVADIEVEAGVDVLWRVLLHDQYAVLFRLASGGSSLECRDLLTDTVVWTVPVAEDSVFSNVVDDVVAVLSEGRQLKLIRADTGHVISDLAVEPVVNPRELHLRSSHGRYLVLPEAVNDPALEPTPALNSMHVHGRIWALDQQTGALVWEAPVEHLNIRLMIPERISILPNAPILLLISRTEMARPGLLAMRSFHGAQVFDVRTGAVLLNDPDVGMTLNDHWLHIDAAARRLTISFERHVATLQYAAPSPAP